MPDWLPVQNPVFVFTLVLMLILLAPAAMKRSRLPGMVGLLLAGAALGPNALNVLARDQSFVLFGTVGLLYIMFIAALEIDMQVLKRYGSHSVLFGLLTFAIPLSMGSGLGFLLGFGPAAAILLGSIFASHTLLAYPIVSRLGLARNTAVTAAVGGTIITDTLALMVLAVIAASVGEVVSGWLWFKLSAGLVVYMAGLLWLLPRLGRWFFRLAGEDSSHEFVFVLVCVFGSASLAYLVGAEPIVGAFLAGLALNRLIPQNGVLMNRLRFTGEAVFIPFFLISVGMLLDVRIFTGGARAWMIALGMLATIFCTKWLAAVIFQKLMGYSKAEARVVFGLSVAQAAATLAATMVGYNIGLFDEAVVNGAILMIIVTCAMAPWFVEKYGRLIASGQQNAAAQENTRPQRLMVGLAGSPQDSRLVELAQVVRERGQNQPVYLASVVAQASNLEAAMIQSEQVAQRCIDMLDGAEVPAIRLTPVASQVSEGLLRSALENRCTHVLMGWSDKAKGSSDLLGELQAEIPAVPLTALTACRFRGPLSAARRLLVLVAPNVQYESGFLQALKLCFTLGDQLGLQLVFYGEESTRAALLRGLDLLEIDMPLVFQPMEQWGLPKPGTVQPDDVVLVQAGRAADATRRQEFVDFYFELARTYTNSNALLHIPANPEA